MSDLAKWRSVGVVGVRTDGTDHFRRDREKALDLDMKYYEQAVSEGSQPWGTQLHQSVEALRESDKLGRAFVANDLAETYYPGHKAELGIKPWPGLNEGGGPYQIQPKGD